MSTTWERDQLGLGNSWYFESINNFRPPRFGQTECVGGGAVRGAYIITGHRVRRTSHDEDIVIEGRTKKKDRIRRTGLQMGGASQAR